MRCRSRHALTSPSHHLIGAFALAVLVMPAWACRDNQGAAPGAAAAPQTAAVEMPNKEGTYKFAVLGDFGTGSDGQYEMAREMANVHARFKFEHRDRWRQDVLQCHFTHRRRRRLWFDHAARVELTCPICEPSSPFAGSRGRPRRSSSVIVVYGGTLAIGPQGSALVSVPTAWWYQPARSAGPRGEREEQKATTRASGEARTRRILARRRLPTGGTFYRRRSSP